MTVKSVPVEGNKRCYTGPTCRLHSGHWSSYAKTHLEATKDNLAASKTFEEFTARKEAYNKAQAFYDQTFDGLTDLQREITATPSPTKELRERYQVALLNRADADKEAGNNIYKNIPASERIADAENTDDLEKINIYSNDPVYDVKIALTRNKNTPEEVLLHIVKTDDYPAVHVAVATVTKNQFTLKWLIKTSRSDVAQQMAKVALNILQREEAERLAAEESERNKEIQANRALLERVQNSVDAIKPKPAPVEPKPFISDTHSPATSGFTDPPPWSRRGRVVFRPSDELEN